MIRPYELEPELDLIDEAPAEPWVDSEPVDWISLADRSWFARFSDTFLHKPRPKPHRPFISWSRKRW